MTQLSPPFDPASSTHRLNLSTPSPHSTAKTFCPLFFSKMSSVVSARPTVTLTLTLLPPYLPLTLTLLPPYLPLTLTLTPNTIRPERDTGSSLAGTFGLVITLTAIADASLRPTQGGHNPNPNPKPQTLTLTLTLTLILTNP